MRFLSGESVQDVSFIKSVLSGPIFYLWVLKSTLKPLFLFLHRVLLHQNSNSEGDSQHFNNLALFKIKDVSQLLYWPSGFGTVINREKKKSDFPTVERKIKTALLPLSKRSLLGTVHSSSRAIYSWHQLMPDSRLPQICQHPGMFPTIPRAVGSLFSEQRGH